MLKYDNMIFNLIYLLGHLLTSSDPLNQNMPPTISSLCSILKITAECNSNIKYYSFVSGSDHVNFLPATVVLHTLWIRQHNRIATNLKVIFELF